mgnify:CR=1 FL=1
MISNEGNHFCACAYEGTSYGRIFCSKLTPGQPITGLLNLTAIIDEPDIVVRPITIVGHELYLLLDKNAPNGHIVAVDMNNPNQVSLNFILNQFKSTF